MKSILLFINNNSNKIHLGFFDNISKKVLLHEEIQGYPAVRSLSDGVDNILSKFKILLTDIDGIVLGSGPGSFLGLSISLSFVQGLILVLEIPVFYVTSFAGYINLSMNHQTILADAKSNMFYMIELHDISEINNVSNIKLFDVNCKINNENNVFIVQELYIPCEFQVAYFNPLVFCIMALKYGSIFTIDNAHLMVPCYVKNII